ncbi:MAG: carbonic anhydrase [bacterium]
MVELVAVGSARDILPEYRGTPIELLLRHHNLGEPIPASTGTARLLISMCMDHRKVIVVPSEFAYVLRSAGASLRDSEFDVSFAISVGNVGSIALIPHTDCGMERVTMRREDFIRGLVERGGWNAADAAAHFDAHAIRYQIGEPVAFALAETARVRALYPSIQVAPLLYRVADDRIVQIRETGGERA